MLTDYQYCSRAPVSVVNLLNEEKAAGESSQTHGQLRQAPPRGWHIRRGAPEVSDDIINPSRLSVESEPVFSLRFRLATPMKGGPVNLLLNRSRRTYDVPRRLYGPWITKEHT